MLDNYLFENISQKYLAVRIWWLAPTDPGREADLRERVHLPPLGLEPAEWRGVYHRADPEVRGEEGECLWGCHRNYL